MGCRRKRLDAQPCRFPAGREWQRVFLLSYRTRQEMGQNGWRLPLRMVRLLPVVPAVQPDAARAGRFTTFSGTPPESTVAT